MAGGAHVRARRGHRRKLPANHICMMHEGGVVCCERIARFNFNSSTSNPIELTQNS
jgi:hypothetical protein